MHCVRVLLPCRVDNVLLPKPKKERGRSSGTLSKHVPPSCAVLFVIIVVQPIGRDSEKLKTLPYRGTLDDQRPRQEINTGIPGPDGADRNTSFNISNGLYMPNE